MKIKICGMREPQNIKDVAALQPDYMGYIFYARSPRFAGKVTNHETLLTKTDNSIKTAVFVDEQIPEICRVQRIYQFGAVQLHGNETSEFCKNLRDQLPSGVQIFRAFGMADEFDFSKLITFQPFVDFFLFDTSTIEKGGSGKTFDWAILKNYHLDTPYWLSGGIGIEEIEQVLKTGFLSDTLYGIDLNSRLETEPGHKDISKVASIMKFRDACLNNE